MVQDGLKEGENIYVKRDSDGQYIFYRRMIENRMRTLFLNKGGKPIRQTPHYVIIGECEYCKSWYKVAEFIRVPIAELDLNTVSFTYGDSFPTFDPTHGDNSEYRQNVYTSDEIQVIIQKYGWPRKVQCNEVYHIGNQDILKLNCGAILHLINKARVRICKIRNKLIQIYSKIF